MPPLAITFLEELATVPEDQTTAPEDPKLSDIIELLEIDEDQVKEQFAIDAAVTATLGSINDMN